MTTKILPPDTQSASFSGAPSLPLSEKLKKVIEKIKDCIASAFQMIHNFFSSIYQGIVNLFSKVSAITYFKNSFSDEKIFSSEEHKVDIRTDGEPDDTAMLVHFALEAAKALRANGFLPIINVIVSEGDAQIKEKKIETLQILLAKMVEDGLIPEKLLEKFRFYSDPYETFDKDKRAGYEAIYEAALGSKTDAVTNLMGQYFAETLLIDNLYQNMEATFNPEKTEIFELNFAPVEPAIRFYENHPNLAKNVTWIGYGSFNLVAAIDRITGKGQGVDAKLETGKRISDCFSKFKAVLNFEAFLATGHKTTNAKGKTTISDFNKIGQNATPDIVEPLVSERASLLQQTLKNIWVEWSKSSLDARVEYFTETFGDAGKQFLDHVNEKIKTCGLEYDLTQAVNDAKKHLGSLPDFDEKKVRGKLNVYISLVLNNLLQGTLSDLTVRMIQANPELLLNPEAVAQGRTIRFEKDPKGARINTIFSSAPGNSFAIQSRLEGEENIPGLKIDKLKDAVREFFASLYPTIDSQKDLSEHEFVKV